MQIPVANLTQNMPWSVAYQAVLTGEGVGMNLTAAEWLTLIQFLVVFCTHSHPPQLCHSPEVKKVTFLMLGGLCYLAATANALSPCQEKLASTHPPSQDAANN